MVSESNDTVLLTTFSDSTQANIVKGQLEEAGVSAHLSDEHIVDTNPLLGSAVGGVKLWVPESEAEEAKRTIEEVTDDSDPLMLEDEELLDLDEEDRLPETILTCPKCGSQDIGFSNLFSVYWAIVVVSIAVPAIPAVSMSVGFAITGSLVLVGVVLMVLRKFPLMCKDCGERGRRSVFQDNPRAASS